MFNNFVCNALEVIFGLWLICVFVEFFFDVDIPSLIKKSIVKLVNKGNEK